MEEANFKPQVYIANKSRIAHLVRQFPDGAIYILCNGGIVTPSPNGAVMTAEEARAKPVSDDDFCPVCQKVLVRALEVMTILGGADPRDAKNATAGKD